jgi:hypothetical protein
MIEFLQNDIAITTTHVLHDGWPTLLVTHDADDGARQLVNGHVDTNDTESALNRGRRADRRHRRGIPRGASSARRRRHHHLDAGKHHPRARRQEIDRSAGARPGRRRQRSADAHSGQPPRQRQIRYRQETRHGALRALRRVALPTPASFDCPRARPLRNSGAPSANGWPTRLHRLPTRVRGDAEHQRGGARRPATVTKSTSRGRPDRVRATNPGGGVTHGR